MLRAVSGSQFPTASDSLSSDKRLRLTSYGVLPVEFPKRLTSVLIAYLCIEIVMLYEFLDIATVYTASSRVFVVSVVADTTKTRELAV